MARLKLLILLIVLLLQIEYAHSQTIFNDVRTVLLPEGSDCFELFPANNTLSNTTCLIRDIGYHIPVLVFGGCLLFIEDESTELIPLPFEYELSDISWAQGYCFFSSGKTIYYCDNNGGVFPIVCAEKEIKRFEVTDNGIVFSFGSNLSFYSFKQQTVSNICTLSDTISDISIVEDVLFLSSGNDIFMAIGRQLFRIYSTIQPIISIACLNDGSLFYSTSDCLFFINTSYQVLKVTDTPLKSLSIINDTLYVTCSDNSCFIISKVSQYRDYLVRDVIP